MEYNFFASLIKSSPEEREKLIKIIENQVRLAKDYSRYEKYLTTCRDPKTKILLEKCKLDLIKSAERGK